MVINPLPTNDAHASGSRHKLNYMKAYVSKYFLHLMLTFSPQNDVMVNGPFDDPFQTITFYSVEQVFNECI